MAVVCVTFASLAGLFVVLLLVTLYEASEISLHLVLHRAFRQLADTWTWPDKTPLVLKEGETIVAVGKTTQGMAFYITNTQEDHDEKN